MGISLIIKGIVFDRIMAAVHRMLAEFKAAAAV